MGNTVETTKDFGEFKNTWGSAAKKRARDGKWTSPGAPLGDYRNCTGRKKRVESWGMRWDDIKP